MSLIQAKNITHKFTNILVLKNISFKVNKKEFVAFVGPLGCGKTTLLKILAGLLSSQKGQVYLSNKQVLKPNPKLAFIFQKANLLPWLTVKQNISLPLKIQKAKKVNLEKKVNQILSFINLVKFKDYYPHHLSGGMEQLAAIARAFISPAEILLLDEPFAHLDSLTREKMNLELLKLWRLKKKTIILVTHNLEEAVFLSQKIFILSKRPAKIKKIIKLNLAYPRKINSPKFFENISQIKKIFV